MSTQHSNRESRFDRLCRDFLRNHQRVWDLIEHEWRINELGTEKPPRTQENTKKRQPLKVPVDFGEIFPAKENCHPNDKLDYFVNPRHPVVASVPKERKPPVSTTSNSSAAEQFVTTDFIPFPNEETETVIDEDVSSPTRGSAARTASVSQPSRVFIKNKPPSPSLEKPEPLVRNVIHPSNDQPPSEEVLSSLVQPKDREPLSQSEVIKAEGDQNKFPPSNADPQSQVTATALQKLLDLLSKDESIRKTLFSEMGSKPVLTKEEPQIQTSPEVSEVYQKPTTISSPSFNPEETLYPLGPEDTTLDNQSSAHLSENILPSTQPSSTSDGSPSVAEETVSSPSFGSNPSPSIKETAEDEGTRYPKGFSNLREYLRNTTLSAETLDRVTGTLLEQGFTAETMKGLHEGPWEVKNATLSLMQRMVEEGKLDLKLGELVAIIMITRPGDSQNRKDPSPKSTQSRLYDFSKPLFSISSIRAGLPTWNSFVNSEILKGKKSFSTLGRTTVPSRSVVTFTSKFLKHLRR